MLINLHAKNIALIKEAEVDFDHGLNILTGETGAGKSMIIGSVNIALGTASFKEFVGSEVSSALVELTFVSDHPQVAKRLAQAGVPFGEGQVVISRKYVNGRSISRVNGEGVTVAFIRELAGDLIDIHGQHQHQSLLYPKFHLELLDRYVKEALAAPMQAYQEAFSEWTRLENEQKNALTDTAERAKRIDLIAYEIREIEEANLVPGEDAALEQTFRRMAQGQRVKEALMEAAGALEGSGRVGDQISRAARALVHVSQEDPVLENLALELSQIEDLLGEFSRDLFGAMEAFSFDEQTFRETEQRLNLINHLKNKYGPGIPEILSYLERQQEALAKLTDYESYLDRLREQCRRARNRVEDLGTAISAIRREGAALLEKKICAALKELNFLHAAFAIDFTPLPAPGAKGLDAVCFLLSTNPGMPLRALQETASGGELSRVMLAIKSVMADEDEAGTLIFDEIDSGISGRTAQRVSEKMDLIARSHQVICITHLAQIAAMADRHFLIEKEAKQEQTATHIRSLDKEERVEELARILGGVEITDATRENAREMLRQAAQCKEAGNVTIQQVEAFTAKTVRK